ncbi:MAG: oligosaccharide flippase family protein [Planctomycetota bacterium]|jgi:O-antigen/teichoic acid export membrane protein
MSESHHADRSGGPDAGEPTTSAGGLAANIAYLTTAQIFANLCILLTNLAVIRCYGQAAHGGVVLVVSTVGLFMLVSDLGLASRAGVRAIARLRATDPTALAGTVSGLVAVQLGFAAVLAAGVVLLAGPMARMEPRLDVPALRLAGTWILAFAIARASLMLFWGFERMRGVLLVNPVRELARLVWVPVCWASGLGVYWVFVGWTAAHLLTCLTAGLGVRSLARRAGLQIRPRRTTLAQALRIAAGGLPYYVPFLGLFGLPLVMPLAVGLLGGTRDNVSTVQVCMALALLPRLLATQIGNAVFPRMSAIQAGARPDQAGTAALLVRSGRLVCLISTFVFAAYAALGADVLGALMAMRYVRVVAWLEVLKYAVLAVSLRVLVPAHGVNGAAIALCVPAAAAVLAKIVITRSLLPRVGGRAFIAALALCAAVTGAVLLPHGRWLAIPVWALGVVATGLLRPGEIALWLAGWKGRGSGTAG